MQPSDMAVRGALLLGTIGADDNDIDTPLKGQDGPPGSGTPKVKTNSVDLVLPAPVNRVCRIDPS
jgi:hypothetical protein